MRPRQIFIYVLGFIHRTIFTIKFAIRALRWDVNLKPSKSKSVSIIISGFFSEALGIGQAGQLIANALEQLHISVARDDLRPFDRGLITRSPWPFLEGKDASIWIINANPPEAKIALYTHSYEVWKNLYRVGCWAWETDVAPAAWVSMARWFHEIWVPSHFVANALSAAFIKAGCENQIAKIHVVPLPVPAIEKIDPKTSNCVQVLTLFDPRSDFVRKNPLGAVDAWLNAFPTPSETAKIIIKSHSSAVNHEHYKTLNSKTSGRNDITLLAKTLDNAGIRKLVSESDILLSLHRGEGYGLPLIEGMAAGLAVIATGWSGNLQFMTSENSILLPYRLVPANKNYNGPYAQWAEPDITAAADSLKKLVADSALRTRLGWQAQQDVRKLCNGWLNVDAFFARVKKITG